MMDELTEEAIEEGRIALRQLEQELKERGNDAVSVGSNKHHSCLLYTSPSPRDRQKSRMPSSA